MNIEHEDYTETNRKVLVRGTVFSGGTIGGGIYLADDEGSFTSLETGYLFRSIPDGPIHIYPDAKIVLGRAVPVPFDPGAAKGEEVAR